MRADAGRHSRLKRILARVDVLFSNSLIEAWRRMLKHEWLYLNKLDSVEAVQQLACAACLQVTVHQLIADRNNMLGKNREHRQTVCFSICGL